MRFMHINIQDDETKVIQTIFSLRGNAARWVSDKINHLKEGEKVVPKVWGTHKEFIQFLREASGQYYDVGETYETRLHTITQGRSTVLKYNEEFERILSYLPDNYGEASKLYNYKRGLQIDLLNRLTAITDSHNWTLEQWMTNVKNSERGAIHVREIKQEYMPRFREQGRPSFQSDVVPMDVDRRTVYKKKGSGKGKCFKCGRIGHFAKDCKVRPQSGQGGQRRTGYRPKRSQLDIIPDEEDQDDHEYGEDFGDEYEEPTSTIKGKDFQ